MRIALVQGTVTTSRIHPSLVGARLKLATPLNLEELGKPSKTGGRDARSVGRPGCRQWFVDRIERGRRSGTTLSTRT